DQQHGTGAVRVDLQPVPHLLDLGDHTIAAVAVVALADAFDDIADAIATVRDLAPLRTREHVDLVEVLRSELHRMPLSIERQFAPHVSAATEEQRATYGILFGV